MNKQVNKLQKFSDIFKDSTSLDNKLELWSAELAESSANKSMSEIEQKNGVEYINPSVYYYNVMSFALLKIGKFSSIKDRIIEYWQKQPKAIALIAEIIEIYEILNEASTRINNLIDSLNLSQEELRKFVLGLKINIEGIDDLKKTINNNKDHYRKTEIAINNFQRRKGDSVLNELNKIEVAAINKEEGFQKFLALTLMKTSVNDFLDYIAIEQKDFLQKHGFAVLREENNNVIQPQRIKLQLKVDPEEASKILHEHLDNEFFNTTVADLSLVFSYGIMKGKIDWLGNKGELQAFSYLIRQYLVKAGTKYPVNIFLSIYFTRKGKEIKAENYGTITDSQKELHRSIVGMLNHSHLICKAFDEIRNNMLILK